MQQINVLPANMKLMNLMKKHPHIIELFVCILSVCFYVVMANKFFIFFRNMFSPTKTVKINNFNILYIQSNPMCINVFLFIKVYYISLILYCSWQIISRINFIKSSFILIILLHFNIC